MSLYAIFRPSQTFREQLEVYHYARCRVSRKDKETRRWYYERTANEVLADGEFDPASTTHLAKYPSTPTPSAPATPQGSVGKRKIRCKNCRRQLATREHMMEHILEQSNWVPRARTPSINLGSPATETPDTSEPEPATSTTTSHPHSNGGGRTPSRKTSVSSPLSQPAHTFNNNQSQDRRVVLDPAALTASLPPHLAALRAGVPRKPSPSNSQPPSPTTATVPPPLTGTTSSTTESPEPTPTHSRRTSQPIRPASRTSNASPPLANLQDVSPRHSFSYGQNNQPSHQAASEVGIDQAGPQNRHQAAKRLSMMALTPSQSGSSNQTMNGLKGLSLSIPSDESAVASDGEAPAGSASGGPPPRRRSSSAGSFMSAREPPILGNDSKCSGYFVEPVRCFMHPCVC